MQYDHVDYMDKQSFKNYKIHRHFYHIENRPFNDKHEAFERGVIHPLYRLKYLGQDRKIYTQRRYSGSDIDDYNYAPTGHLPVQATNNYEI